MPPARPPIAPERMVARRMAPAQCRRRDETWIQTYKARTQAAYREAAPDPVQHDDGEADDESEVQRGRRKQARQLGVLSDQGCCSVGGAARRATAVDEPARQCDRDEIEHERGHHFVHAQASTQEAWSHQPEPAAKDAAANAIKIKTNDGHVGAAQPMTAATMPPR